MDSQLCSKHFEDDCFVTEGVRLCDEMGIPTVKCLKPDAVPNILILLDRWTIFKLVTVSVALQPHDHYQKEGIKDQ